VIATGERCLTALGTSAIRSRWSVGPCHFATEGTRSPAGRTADTPEGGGEGATR
jgi:hypothetical protein